MLHLRVKVRLTNRETGEIKEQDVFMGDFPDDKQKVHFIINGAERVVWSSSWCAHQGFIITLLQTTSGKRIYSATIIPIAVPGWSSGIRCS
ncbi:MAG: hypothetical protein RJR35_00050 [Thermoanaerobacterales bacterium]|nr:hypothetical protein [Thermoanaerobacterales bacterium]